VLRLQIARLEDRKAQLEAALSFLHGKLEWVEADKPGETPRLNDYAC
jgi:MerR family copper efflux transcriptional regulator